MTQWLTLETADGPMRVYEARPPSPTGRAAVILQEAFGVNEHIQEIARRVAERGFLALAPDLFHRSGVGELTYDQRAEAMAQIGQVDAKAIAIDVRAVLDHLRDKENIGAKCAAVIGFCFGGRAAFTAAAYIPGLGAVAVFYGAGIAAGPHALLDRAREVTAPLLMHVGADDPVIPAEQVAAIDAALSGAGVDFKQHVYAAAGHAFACDARPQMFRPQAASDAWERTFAFLDKHLPLA
jgi:carboxymethylenebutenolidase